MQFSQEQRVKIIIAGLVTIVLGTIIVIIVGLVTRLPEATISQPFASNLTYPKQIDDNTLYFFSGSAFASYDLTTHKTSALTPFYTLPFIIKASIAKDGALLHAADLFAGDHFYATAEQQGVDLTNSWWVCDFKTGSIQPISKQGVGDAMWIDENTYLYSVYSDTALLIMRADIGGTSTQLATISNTYQLVGGHQNKLYYLKQVGLEEGAPTELVSLDLDSQKTTSLSKNVSEVLAIGPDGSMLFLVNNRETPTGEDYTEEEPMGMLTLFNATSQTTKKIDDYFTGKAMWQQNDNKWLAVGRNATSEPVSIRNEGDTIQKLKTPVQKGFAYFPVGRTGTGDLLANRNDEVQYASTKPIDNLPNVDAIKKLPAYTFEPAFTYAYDTKARQYNMYIDESPSNKVGLEAALKFFKDKGVDVYQINTKWYGAGPNLYQ